MTELEGRALGDYQVGPLIDEGGNGLVYQGVQTSSDSPVAIKVLKPEVAQERMGAQGFAQYIQLAARMTHPNILSVLASGQVDGHDYLVTPYLGNRSLAEQRVAYTTPEQALALFNALASGLKYLYSQGSIHGNLRPSTILLDAQGQPLLSSFGIPLLDGTPSRPYNSPEEVLGGAVDQRADIYALGVILYELLAGQAPATGTVSNLQAVRPDLPAEIGQLIQKATAQNPDQRYQTVAEMLDAFARALQPAQKPVPAPPPPPARTAPPPPAQPSPPPPAPSGGGTNWTAIILGGLVVVVICLVLAVAGPFLADALNPTPEGEPPVAELPTEPPAVEEPTQAPQPTEEPQPTQPLPEEPTAEEPPLGETPPGDGEGSPPICGSLGFAGGLVLLGGVFSLKRRRRDP